ncbi:hypothetical protein [Corynebacterium variabile]|uniref:Uncharacterized protein n=1 Tax=Corynebacterium variabile TaxID=1727 RepID=A0A4Y4C449_9CORY|nr:hypothetical protein [Corynebacterium variabile]GEC85897.1 hypothetical protein CVA01_12110 [Corynebacterium variabile]
MTDTGLFDLPDQIAPSPEQPDLFAESVDTGRTVIDYITAVNVIRAAADARGRGDHREFLRILNTADSRILPDVLAFATGQLATARRQLRGRRHA